MVNIETTISHSKARMLTIEMIRRANMELVEPIPERESAQESSNAQSLHDFDPPCNLAMRSKNSAHGSKSADERVR